MAQDNLPVAQAVAREYWNQARRKAFWQKFSKAIGFSKQPTNLLSFEEVQHTLRLAQNTYRGLQVVSLDKVVGSVGRYHDFTRTFLPLVESDGPRWQRIAELQMDTGLRRLSFTKWAMPTLSRTAITASRWRGSSVRQRSKLMSGNMKPPCAAWRRMDRSMI